MTPGGMTPAVLSVANLLLAPGPSELNVTLATGPDGTQAIIATIRTSSGEQTVWLTRDEAITWREALDAKITKMTRLILPPPGTIGPNGSRP